MEVKAKAKYIKMSPRKVRLVVDIIRGLATGKALDQLRFNKKKAVNPLEKLIKSAIANAVNNFDIKEDNLYIKEIRVDEGPTLHRWKPRARGRATPIRKRTSHVSLALAELTESGVSAAKKQTIEAPVKLGAKPHKAEGVKIKDKDEIKDAKQNKQEFAEQTSKISDPRGDGHGKHTKIEGGVKKGFVNKIFRRKSG